MAEARGLCLVGVDYPADDELAARNEIPRRANRGRLLRRLTRVARRSSSNTLGTSSRVSPSLFSVKRLGLLRDPYTRTSL